MFGTLASMGIAKNAGRSTRRYKRLKADLRQLGLPCWICGQAIDYEAKAPDPASFTVDHVLPRGAYRELAEDAGNLRPAHFSCNDSKSNRVDFADLGFTSRSW